MGLDFRANPMTRPPHNFNRDRFLLRCVAWVLGVHFGLWGIVGLSCVRIWHITALDKDLPTISCPQLVKAYQDSSKGVLLILVALLAGGGIMTIAVRNLRGDHHDNDNEKKP
jgi:hypothetical protein